ncbi:hypothetical protein [Flavobacterium sp. 25HG05S-40]|uniref:hypothetical protein n=1 Tax=Flavobacterium sp. 25HG05S-40 TaxID=3458682 RepID=UPI00404473C7
MKKLSMLIIVIILISCKKEATNIDQNPDKEAVGIHINEVAIDTTTSLGLNSFDEFPEEIDGPGCFFSIDEKDYSENHYVYADNADSICYIKMNGKFIRFELLERNRDTTFNSYVRKFKSDDYELSVDVKKVDEIDEINFYKGSMFIKHKNEAPEEKELYGVCGC